MFFVRNKPEEIPGILMRGMEEQHRILSEGLSEPREDDAFRVEIYTYGEMVVAERPKGWRRWLRKIPFLRRFLRPTV